MWRHGSSQLSRLVLILVVIPLLLAADKVYFTDPADFDATGVIYRANLDGSSVGQVAFVGGKGGAGGVAVDGLAGKLYYTDPSDCTPFCGAIYRADRDGANAEFLLSADFPRAITCEPHLAKIWWSNQGERRIYRGNLDGTDDEPILFDVFSDGLAADRPSKPRRNARLSSGQSVPARAVEGRR